MNRSWRVGAGAAALGLLVVTAGPGFGADSGAVTGSVTTSATGPCITVEVSSVDFGVLPFSDGGVSEGSSGLFTLTNCSDVAEDFLVQGTDAVSTTSAATWELDTAPVDCAASILNQYQMGSTNVDDPNNPVLVLFDEDAASLLYDGVAVTGTRDTALTIRMPCEGSDGAGETMQNTNTYIATLD